MSELFPEGRATPGRESVLERLQGYSVEPPDTPDARERFALELIEYLPDLTFLIATAADYIEKWDLMDMALPLRFDDLKHAVERVVDPSA